MDPFVSPSALGDEATLTPKAAADVEALNGRVALSPAEFARRLGVTREFLYDEMARGNLASFRVGRHRRIPVSELERLLASAK